MVYVFGSRVAMCRMCVMALEARCDSCVIFGICVVCLVWVSEMCWWRKKERRSGFCIRNNLPSAVLRKNMYLVMYAASVRCPINSVISRLYATVFGCQLRCDACVCLFAASHKEVRGFG